MGGDNNIKDGGAQAPADQWYEPIYTIGFPVFFFLVVCFFAWKYGHDSDDEIDFMNKMDEI